MRKATCKSSGPGPGVLVKPCDTVQINHTMDTTFNFSQAPIIQSKDSRENLNVNLKNK